MDWLEQSTVKDRVVYLKENKRLAIVELHFELDVRLAEEYLLSIQSRANGSFARASHINDG